VAWAFRPYAWISTTAENARAGRLRHGRREARRDPDWPYEPTVPVFVEGKYYTMNPKPLAIG
jgi:hypothetical protein